MSLMFRYHFRILWIYLRWRFAGKPRALESKLAMKASASDCDWLGHINNARYLEIFDAARTDLILRSGVAAAARDGKFIALVGTTLVRYRKEVKRGTRFEVRSRYARIDGKAIVISQQIYLGDQLATDGEISVLVVKAGKVVAPDFLRPLIGL